MRIFTHVAGPIATNCYIVPAIKATPPLSIRAPSRKPSTALSKKTVCRRAISF